MSTFAESKVAQAAAYFLNRQGGTMPHLKLIKLLYLMDRESMQRYGEPISWDRHVSMPHGPVPSGTLNLLNGEAESSGEWGEWVSPRYNHTVSLTRPIDKSELDRLSDADIDVLNGVWDQFGHMTQWDLRDWTHRHCAEWKDPGQSSLPIHARAIFVALGAPDSLARSQSARMQRHIQTENTFARHR